MLTCKELQRRLDEERIPIVSIMLHPGTVYTGEQNTSCHPSLADAAEPRSLTLFCIAPQTEVLHRLGMFRLLGPLSSPRL